MQVRATASKRFISRSRGRRDWRKYEPPMEPVEFYKQIRKPDGLFEQSMEAVKKDLRALGSLSNAGSLESVLSEEERVQYQKMLMTTLLYAKPIAKNVNKSAFGLPLFGASIYSHMFAGLGNYCLKKQGMDNIVDAMKIATYYRSPVLFEELQRMGYTEKQIQEIVSKQFYMQYWSGDPFGPNKDPLIFNPMVRSFYPPSSQVTSGSTDLGRETEVQAAKLYAMGREGIKPPVTVIHTGDTGAFTDGAMHALQHMFEAAEEGYSMPIIFLISANNAAISSRIDYGAHWGDNGDFGIKRIQERFEQWGPCINQGQTTWAEDVEGGIKSMRSAVDQVLDTGKPTYCISRFPFRPGGHASDSNPAAEDMLMEQFVKFKDVLVQQLGGACASGTTPGELVDMIEDMERSIDKSVVHALKGCNVMSRTEIRELSEPGSTTILENEPGDIIDISPNYLLGKAAKGYSGMGSSIFGQAINKQMDIGDAEGIPVRYVHQENHHKGKHDTRGGVYGELNDVEAKHSDKFYGFMPQEAQVAQVGLALRSVLPGKNRIFVKGPHTLFNEHAADHLKYGAFRKADAGEHGNTLYFFDAGSLATQEKDTFVDEETGEEVIRDLFLARVGEHHNTPDYTTYSGDANTVMCLPIDMNIIDRAMPKLVELMDMGRQVLCGAPTLTYGMLHQELAHAGTGKKFEGTIGQNDTLRFKFPGPVKPLNGKKLVILGWGPDTKMIAQVLAQEKLEAELLVLSYNRCPNSLVSHLEAIANEGEDVEVVCVDPNPNAALLGPVVIQLRKKLDWPENLLFSFATIDSSFVPYGLGDPLLQAEDVLRGLRQREVIPGRDFVKAKFTRTLSAAHTTSSSTASPSSSASSTSGSGAISSVYAPMDGEGVTITYHVKAGDAVNVDDLIAEIESDKATIEVVAPAAGTIEKLIAKSGEAMDVTPETEICTISEGGSSSSTSSTTLGDPITVNAPMDGESVTIYYKVEIGDQLKADDLIAEVESDKATIEIVAPCDCVVSEFIAETGKEMDVTPDTPIVKVQPSTGGATSPSGEFARTASAKRGSAGQVDDGVPIPLMSSLDEMPAIDSTMAMDAPGRGNQIRKVNLNNYQKTMLEQFTVREGDTRPFYLFEKCDFDKLYANSKAANTKPAAYMIKQLATALEVTDSNFKLSPDKKQMLFLDQVDIGCAVDVNGQLRVAVVRDCANKTAAQIHQDIVGFVNAGAKLSIADQDLTNVCFTVSSMGKDSCEFVVPVLIKNTTGIIGVGKVDDSNKTGLFMTVCHATMTGIQGAGLMHKYIEMLEK